MWVGVSLRTREPRGYSRRLTSRRRMGTTVRKPPVSLGPIVALVVVALVVVACGPSPDGAASAPGPDAQPETRRGPVSLEHAELFLVQPDELSLDVPSCHGDPELARLVEDADAIHLEVVTTQVVRGPADDCLDGLAVVLEAPLGDRAVIDLVSGATLTVADQTEVLACADHDLPGTPTFDTPEEALADVLERQPGPGPVPDRAEDYERHDREGQVFFEYVEDEHVLYNWGVQRGDDGRWGVVSIGGCF
jgi:hypothetical protein